MFLALGLNDVPGVMNNALRTLCAWLCEFLYPLIADLYQLFMNMGKVAYSDDFTTIYNKISLIIGIFMVFRVTFWLIEIMVSPDKISDKEKNPTKIIQKVLIAVVMLAITPTIFEYAFKFQNLVIDENVIGNIMSVSGVDSDPSNAGRYLAAELFTNFYNENLVSDSKCSFLVNNEQLGSVYSQLNDFGELNITNTCLTAKYNNDEEYQINFNGLFAVAVGAFVFWMLLMYCISIAARYIQLIYLQVIAPIPIMCYLTPNKDSMFSKWTKQCTTTYLDLFIRIGIVNLVILLSNVILNDVNGVFSTFENGWIVTIFMILGLLMFAKKAPELVQELLPKSVKASGDFGVSLKKRTDAMFGYKAGKRAVGFAAGGAVGALTGGALGALGGKGVGSRIASSISGAYSGFKTGSRKGGVIKNVKEVRKNQAAQNSRLQQWRINANKDENVPNTFGDWMSRKSDASKKAMGFETKYAELKRDTDFANTAASSYKNIIDFGSGKALEKNKSLKSFGIERGIADLEAVKNSKAAEYQEFTAEKLLTTPEGKLKLKNISRNLVMSQTMNNLINTKFNELKKDGLDDESARKQSVQYANDYIKSNNKALESTFDIEFDKMSEVDKVRAAENAVEYLRKESIEATQLYEDNKKQAGFVHLVEEYAAGQDQNIKNEFSVMNDFLRIHPEIAEQFGLDKPEDGKEYFDAIEMNRLRLLAENDKDAQVKFEKLFKSFDKFKTLKSIYVAKNNEAEALRDKANDQYNGK